MSDGLSIIWWNVCGNVISCFQELVRLKKMADVITFGEGVELSPELVEIAMANHYHCYSFPYNDSDNRGDKHCYNVFINASVTSNYHFSVSTERIGKIGDGTDQRTIVKLLIDGHELFFVHLDDRCTASRFEQMHDLSEIISLSNNKPLSITAMGDFNIIYGGIIGRIARSRLVHALEKLLPKASDPGSPNRSQNKLARLNSLASRLSDMANSEPFNVLIAYPYTAGIEMMNLKQKTMRHMVQLDYIVSFFRDSTVSAAALPMESGYSDHSFISYLIKSV